MAKSMAKQIRRCGRSSPSTTRYLLVGKDGHANLDTQLIWLRLKTAAARSAPMLPFCNLGSFGQMPGWAGLAKMARLGSVGQKGARLVFPLGLPLMGKG
jgi:hypothetical protein